MADRVVQSNYESMMSALQTFANGINEETDELRSITNVCATGLGDSDAAVKGMVTNINEIEKNLLKCAKQALTIAKEMNEELEAILEEQKVWDQED